jgi:hypothetical protein
MPPTQTIVACDGEDAGADRQATVFDETLTVAPDGLEIGVARLAFIPI